MSVTSQIAETLPACIPDGLDSILLNKSPLISCSASMQLPGQSPVDPLIDRQLAELLLLLQQQQEQQQQQPVCYTPDTNSNDLPVLDDQSDAEQAIDAEISQLLALKQAKKAQRSQLMLLQQISAGLPGNAAAVSTDDWPGSMTGLQGHDLLSSQQQTQRPVSLAPSCCHTPTGLSPNSMAASLAATPGGGFFSRTSIDLGYLQHRMSPAAAPLEALCDVRSPGSAGSLPTVELAPYAAPALQAPLAAAGVQLGSPPAASLALQADGMAGPFGALSLQDSCGRGPSTPNSAALPLPALYGLPHPALSAGSSYEQSQRQQQQQQSSMLPPCVQMQAYNSGSFSQGQMVGRAGSSPEVLPHQSSAHSRGLYASSPLQLPPAGSAGQGARVRRHSFHLTPSTPPGAAAGYGSAAYRAAGAPAAAAPARATVPLAPSSSNRRASVCVASQDSVLLGSCNTPFAFGSGCREGPNMLAAEEAGLNRRAQSFTMTRPQHFEPAMLPLQECPAARSASAAPCTGARQCLPASGSPNNPYCLGPGACGGSASSLQYTNASQAVGGCGAGRSSIDLPCHAAAPKWAGSFWHPLVDVLKSGKPASKGTGVFMPRTGTTPATGDKEQAD